MQHLDPHLLLEAAEGSAQLAQQELEHLRACDDCRDWLRMFTRNFTQTWRRPVKPESEAA